MKQSVLRKYARLIAKVGANVQPGQPVMLTAAVEQSEFAVMVAEELYLAGSSRVDMEWTCQAISKLEYNYQSEETLCTYPAWKEEKMKLMAKEFPCRVFLNSDDPDGLKGVDTEKMTKSRKVITPITKPYRDAIASKHQWCIAAVPSTAWAKKVFPDLSDADAVEALWDAILKAVHVSDDPSNDPIAEWAAHNDNLHKRGDWLNAQKFDYLTYHSANGTDFRVDLNPLGLWKGGSDSTTSGCYYNANLPTEEIFTSPMSGKAEGKLVSTKPLSYQGQLINNFWIRFENGTAVEWDAEQGKELLGQMLTMDEGASRLGEVALIPCESPINRSGILFYKTLYDENASCHFAMGNGFNNCLEGGKNMTSEECHALGVNESMIHVDFMVGADDMCITGYKNGVATPVFINGTWAQKI
jgi:aminopeptidase